jgi:hypothetical protein
MSNMHLGALFYELPRNTPSRNPVKTCDVQRRQRAAHAPLQNTTARNRGDQRFAAGRTATWKTAMLIIFHHKPLQRNNAKRKATFFFFF